METFDSTTLEGLIFLEKRLISGFNLENDEFLNVISLNLKYYHNLHEHIFSLTQILNKDFQRRFSKELEVKEHEKIGLFRWEKYFDDEPGNEYFIVEKEKRKFSTTSISYSDIKIYDGPGFIIAKDQTKVLNFLISEGEEGEFLYKFLREKCSKKIFENGIMKDNPVIDERCHQIPLFIVKDTHDLIEDKSGLVKVTNLKFIKEDKFLQSIAKPEEVNKILSRFGDFECEFELKKENRYVGLEFAQYM